MKSLIPRDPPPGPFRRSFWRSPVRGPWLTSVLGLVLLASIPVMFVTGLLSYAAYNPDLSPVNDLTPGKGLLGFYLFSWPTHPVWLYRVSQGLHVTLGLTLVPVLLFKLWSVLPKLFEWPPLRSPAHALERLSLFLLVGGAVFEFATGILNIQTWYTFPGSFYPLHFYGAWVFIAGLVVHVVIKFPVMIRALRSRGFWAELRTNLASTRPEPPEAGYLAPVAPGVPTISRRGVLAFAGTGSALIALLSAGQSLGGPLRWAALLAPRGQDVAAPDDFQVNQTAASAGIRASATGQAWRLTVGSDGRPAARPPSPSAGPTCSAWSSTPPACRSRASRAGPPTTRTGPASGSATWPGWPASAARRAPWSSHWNAAGHSARSSCPRGRSWTPTRCSPCGSTARTSPLTTATPPG